MYEIDLIPLGESDVRGPEAFFMDRWEEWVTLVYYAVLVRGEGRTLLINTGPPADADALSQMWIDYMGDPRGGLRSLGSPGLAAELQGRGVACEEVDELVLSPLSAYATGNLHLFPNATLSVSRAAWFDLLDPTSNSHRIAPRETMIPAPALSRMATDWWARLHLLEDEDTVGDGIATFRSGVHHRGSLAVRIPTSAGTVIWTDSAYVRGNVERLHPIGLARSLDEAYSSYARIAREADIVLPAFEPALMDEFEGGRIS